MSNKLKFPHKAAWVMFIFASEALNREIDARLQEAGVVQLDVYDVLLNLEEAPDHHLKMSELADRVLISKSGLTRVVDRLEKLGYVERGSCPGDRRAVYASLTAKGLAERERAWPIYEKALVEVFASKLSVDEAEVLRNVMGRFIPTGHPILKGLGIKTT
jgi:DNA-binding MarR family transcriptional regulator